MRGHEGRKGSDSDLVAASEIACWAYCPEQWRLEFGLRLEPGNRAALDAGDRHHAGKAITEWIAGGSIGIGRIVAVLAVLVLLLLWVLSR